MRDDRESLDYFVVFLLGATAGALLAVLLAPRSGRETRELLVVRGGQVARGAQARGERLARRTQELAGQAQSRAGEWLDRGREAIEEQTQKLADAVEAGRDAMRDEIRKGAATTPNG